jgi:hypothetical protein
MDPAGDTSSHRLGVFAPRAAPLQLPFLGHPHTPGPSGID